jgi:hypothetical protein
MRDDFDRVIADVEATIGVLTQRLGQLRELREAIYPDGAAPHEKASPAHTARSGATIVAQNAQQDENGRARGDTVGDGTSRRPHPLQQGVDKTTARAHAKSVPFWPTVVGWPTTARAHAKSDKRAKPGSLVDPVAVLRSHGPLTQVQMRQYAPGMPHKALARVVAAEVKAGHLRRTGKGGTIYALVPTGNGAVVQPQPTPRRDAGPARANLTAHVLTCDSGTWRCTHCAEIPVRVSAGLPVFERPCTAGSRA